MSSGTSSGVASGVLMAVLGAFVLLRTVRRPAGGRNLVDAILGDGKGAGGLTVKPPAKLKPAAGPTAPRVGPSAVKNANTGRGPLR